MTVNVRLLKKVRKLIAEEPRRLDMDTWGRRYPTETAKGAYILPPCGTVACLAGWTVLAATPKRSWGKLFTERSWRGFSYNRDEGGISRKAAALLGIKREDCPFYQFKWKAPEVLAWIDRQIDAAK